MDWNKGYSSAWYGYVIDPTSWRETTRLNITGGSIAREIEGLRESADIDCVGYGNGPERWIRIYLDAKQGGTSEHIPVFTGLACSPARSIDGNYETNTLQCYSVLKPAQDILLPRGYYIPAWTNGAEMVRELLTVTPAPVFIEGNAPSLTMSIIAEDGETHLSLAEKVLTAIGWRLRISGDGNITICQETENESGSFDALQNDSIEPVLQIESDWYECPNVFRAIQDELTAVARDDSPESPLSTVNRGREVWAEESSCDFNSGESIAEYASRRLRELQAISVTASYDRRFDPNILAGDLVRLKYPRQGLDGLYTVTSQRIEIGFGARTTEEVRKA